MTNLSIERLMELAVNLRDSGTDFQVEKDLAVLAYAKVIKDRKTGETFFLDNYEEQIINAFVTRSYKICIHGVDLDRARTMGLNIVAINADIPITKTALAEFPPSLHV